MIQVKCINSPVIIKYACFFMQLDITIAVCVWSLLKIKNAYHYMTGIIPLIKHAGISNYIFMIPNADSTHVILLWEMIGDKSFIA